MNIKPNVKLYIKVKEDMNEYRIYYVNDCETECEIVHQSKWRFKCVIKCQIYYVNDYKNECEIVHQSKRRYECVIKCQIYYVN